MDVSREYESAFAVEKSKLTRLLSLIHQRMATLQEPVEETYEAHLSGLKTVINNSITEIFALDNSHRSRIERLVVSQKAAAAPAKPSDHRVQVDFNGKMPADVTISIRGTDGSWVLETMSVVEEQVERMLETSPLQKI
jgi:uncharacterized protein with von Willebrand factor type A (vWA) domain